MSLYNFNAILKIAQERDFKAIGSFNLHCIEMLPAFFKAAATSEKFAGFLNCKSARCMAFSSGLFAT